MHLVQQFEEAARRLWKRHMERVHFTALLMISLFISVCVCVHDLQYDLSASTFSPDGRVFQVEYAMKAVENSR